MDPNIPHRPLSFEELPGYIHLQSCIEEGYLSTWKQIQDAAWMDESHWHVLFNLQPMFARGTPSDPVPNLRGNQILVGIWDARETQKA